MTVSKNLPLCVSQLKTLAANVTNGTPDAGVAGALTELSSVDVLQNASQFANLDIASVLKKSKDSPIAVAALDLLSALLAMPSNQPS